MGEPETPWSEVISLFKEYRQRHALGLSAPLVEERQEDGTYKVHVENTRRLWRNMDSTPKKFEGVFE